MSIPFDRFSEHLNTVFLQDMFIIYKRWDTYIKYNITLQFIYISYTKLIVHYMDCFYINTKNKLETY